MIASIYARKSTDQSRVSQNEKSVARQVEGASEYATSKGWRVAEEHIYVDDGISGAEFDRRPGYVRLLNSLKPKAPFSVLIVSELSRLGREQFEVGYACKQLSQAGVRIFSYLEGKELELSTPTDKFLLSAVNYASEIERDKAAQRVTDTMLRKAQLKHVCGGRVFGYDNHEVLGEDGRRSHVERRINESEADVVKQICDLYTSGQGLKAIANQLNVDGALCPRPQQSRPKGWSPSSIRDILRRPLYRGEIVYGRTAKRDRWGQKKQQKRDRSKWIEISAPELRIVSKKLAEAVDARIAAMGSRALRTSDGRLSGRPPGEGAKYLLTGLLKCEICGGGFEALSRKHGKRRAYVYGCATHRRKGSSICDNNLVVPMKDADQSVLSAIEDTLMNPAVVEKAIDNAIRELERNRSQNRRGELEDNLADVEKAIQRFTRAIAKGGDLDSLVEALKAQETRKQEILAILFSLEAHPVKPTEVRHQLEGYLTDWRGLLRSNVAQGQQALRRLIDGRLTFTPDGDHYKFKGVGTVEPVLGGLVQKLVSPTGFEPVLPA